MSSYDYDFFVIGAGSGGVRAARLAAMLGKKVGVAEEYRVGGTCVIRGCVPKKLMTYAADVAHQLEIAKGYGWTIENARFDWSTFMTEKDVEIARLSGIYAANLAKSGAEMIHSKARLLDAHTVELVDKGATVTAETILIATGGRPWLPSPDQLPGVEHAITSDQAFHLPELPKRILIAGGGYIAVEFAGIFHGLGSDVTLLYRGPSLLRGFDDDVRSHLGDELRKRGLRVVVGAQHTGIEKTATGLRHHLTNGMTLDTDVAMFAVGRRPYVDGLGLDAAGVALNADGAIQVDEYSRTSVPNVFAVGDVTDRLNLTPVAIREAIAFVETAFKNNPQTVDYKDVPTAVFSQPPIGTVGYTEADARRVFGKVDVYLSRFRPMKTAFAKHEERTLMKLVVDPATDKVLGVHLVGPDSGELIQLAGIAIKAGVTKTAWDSTVAVHPTAAEELVFMREPYMPAELQAAE